jgi:hypothetical protein
MGTLGRRKIIFYFFVFNISACASLDRPARREPASMTKLHRSSYQVYSVLEYIGKMPGLFFSTIESVKVIDSKKVAVYLKDDETKLMVLNFSTVESKCSVRPCAFEVNQVE